MKFNLQKTANPYMVFCMAWALCLALYVIGWSELFPKISTPLLIFLSVVILVFLALSFFYNRIKSDTVPPGLANMKISNRALFIFNLILWLCNFAYSGIPILTGLRDADFGIPTVIVLATSLNSFTILCYFFTYLHSGKKILLLNIGFCFIIFVMIISRGGIMMTASSMFFLWLNVKKPLVTFKKVLLIIASIFFVMYLFGVAGNYRTIKDVASYTDTFDQSYNSDIILGIGQASDSFENSIIPGEFFWSYLYITSPLSNLQYNLNRSDPSVTLDNVVALVNNEIVFDAVSKRVDDVFNTVRKKPALIVEQLTVCTTLAGSYLYAGWTGMIIFILFFAVIPIFYLFLINKNPLGIIGISVLCSIYFLSIFDNMLTLTGFSIQILYPFVLFYFNKIKLPTLSQIIKPVNTIYDS